MKLNTIILAGFLVSHTIVFASKSSCQIDNIIKEEVIYLFCKTPVMQSAAPSPRRPNSPEGDVIDELDSNLMGRLIEELGRVENKRAAIESAYQSDIKTNNTKE
jgi:hypothetical protein